MKKYFTNMKASVYAVLTFAMLSISSVGFTQCVTTASFGGSAVTESFEGYAVDANNPTSTFGSGYTQPGAISSYTFASGIVLSAPIPNSEKVLIGDFTKGSATWGLTASSIGSAADIPSGSAYLGLFNGGGSVTATFTLPANSTKVGMLVQDITGGTVTLTAYNSSNVVIGTCSVAADGLVSSWPTKFLGFNSNSGDIAKVQIDGTQATVIDQFTFESCLAPVVNLGGPYSQCEGSVTLDAGSLSNGNLITEGFDAGTAGTTYTPSGWAQQNNSTTIGTSAWFAGGATFTSHSGAGYMAANFNSTTGANDISNWLFTPNLTLNNGDVFSFWTRTVSSPAFPDRLQVRLSTNGSSTNVGAGAAAVGDYTTLLLDINPTLTVNGFPNTWTQYSVTISGLGGPTSGRLAFRYFVTNGGPSGANSDFIGLDDVLYTEANPAVYAWSNGGTSQTTTVSTSDTYTVTVTNSNTGCSATASASVAINTNPVVNLGGPYTVCGGSVTLDAGNAGASYAWSDGTTTTQTLNAISSNTYAVTVTDANTCTGSASASVTVNQAPSSVTDYTICQNQTVPSGEGLLASGCGTGATTVTSFSGATSLSDPTFNRGQVGTTYNASAVGTAVNFSTQNFTVTTSGSYTFSLCAGYDAFLHVYAAPFNPASPATNFLVADDDGYTGTCSGGSQATLNLTAGTEYVFVATSFDNGDVGAYTVTFTGTGAVQQGAPSTIEWYDLPSGGTSVGSGSPFNPVGTTALPNTSTPGTYTFYTACSASPDCRTAVDFVVNASPTVNLGGPFTQCEGTVTLDAGGAGTNPSFTEGLDAGTSGILYTPTGWAQQNNSTSIGTTTWFGGNSTVFAAHTGAGYIAANFNSTTGADNISNWLFTPNLTLTNGDVFSFWSRTVDAPQFADRLQVRLSTNGASTNVGATDASVGDFSTLLLDINPTLTLAGYPNTWTQYSITVSGLSGPTSGRLAFRYFVANAGPSGSNSDYIGVDDVQYTSSLVGDTYAWSNGATTQTTTVSTSNTYTVTVTSANSCSASGSAVVTINTNPVVNLGGPYTSCSDPVTLDAGNAGSTFAWSDGTTTTQTLSATTTDTYSVTVTDANTCSATASASVTINLPPSSTTDYTICQNGTVPSGDGLLASGCAPAITTVSSFTGATTLSSPTFTRSLGGTTYTASTVGTDVSYATHDFTVNTTGSYTFTLCAGFDTYLHIYTAPFNPASPATNFLVANDDDAACGSGSEATLTLTAGTNYVFVTTAFDNGDVGAYTVTFTGAGAVQQTVNSTIEWYDLSSGGTLQGSGSPFNPVGTTALPNTSTPGTYTFYAACSANPGCRTAVDFVINANPVVNLGNDVEQCGGNVTLDAGNAGSTFAWSDGTTTTQTLVASSTDTYSVTVTDANSCSATDEVDVTINAVPTVDLGNDVEQCGGSVTLDAGNAGSTFAWSDGITTTQTLVASSTDTYSVTVTDANSCSATDEVDVTINAVPVVDLGNDVEQCGGSVTLDAGNAGSTFAWSDGITTTQTLVASSTDTYSVTVTDANSCSATDEVDVTINAVPVVDLGNDVEQCGGSVTLDAGNAGSTFAWSDGTTTTQTLVASSTDTYSVTVTDANSCSATDEVDVTINALPVVDLGNDVEQCGGSVTLDAGNAGSTFAWSDGTTTTQTLVASSTDTYSVTVTDANLCSATDEVDVTINTLPVVDLGNDVEQCGGSVTLDAGNAGSTFAWSDGTTTTQTLVASSTDTYSVTVTDANSCSATDEVDVTINALPVVDLGNDVEQCGGSVTLDAGNAGSTFAWSDGTTTTQTLVASSTDTYSVTVTDANSCSATDEVDVTINALPVVDLGNDVEQCGGSVTLDAGNAGSTFAWSDGTTTTQTLTVTVGNSYAVTVTSANSCTASDDVDVTINANPTATLSLPQDSVCSGSGTITLSGGSPAGGTFSGTNVTGNNFNPSTNGTFTIAYAVADNNGCKDTAYADITVYVCVGINELTAGSVELFPIPASDFVTLRTSGINGKMQVEIYDITGKKVEQLTDVNIASGYTRTISLSTYAAGTYIVNITTENGTVRYNLIVQ
jgi:glutamine cyclotransferase